MTFIRTSSFVIAMFMAVVIGPFAAGNAFADFPGYYQDVSCQDSDHHGKRYWGGGQGWRHHKSYRDDYHFWYYDDVTLFGRDGIFIPRIAVRFLNEGYYYPNDGVLPFLPL